jgi:hypothetical protein
MLEDSQIADQAADVVIPPYNQNHHVAQKENGPKYANMQAFMKRFQLIIYMSRLYTARAAIQLPTVSGSPPDASPIPLAIHLLSSIPQPDPPILSKTW